MTNSQGMSKGPLIAVIVSIIAVVAIYFGLPTKDESQRQIETSRALNFEKVNVPGLLKEAKAKLNEEESVFLSELERPSGDEELDKENLKSLSREWFNRGEYILAAHYAEEIAQRDSSAQAFAIAGNTYSIAMQQYEDQDLVNHAKEKAVRNYERAISVDSDELEYRINLAVTYAEKPDADNPMKGVMMLLDLEKNFPEDPRVQNTLAFYGIQTGQIEKARNRLLGVLENFPDDQRANCLMAKLLQQIGESGFEPYEQKCNK